MQTRYNILLIISSLRITTRRRRIRKPWRILKITFHSYNYSSTYNWSVIWAFCQTEKYISQQKNYFDPMRGNEGYIAILYNVLFYFEATSQEPGQTLMSIKGRMRTFFSFQVWRHTCNIRVVSVQVCSSFERWLLEIEEGVVVWEFSRGIAVGVSTPRSYKCTPSILDRVYCLHQAVTSSNLCTASKIH